MTETLGLGRELKRPRVVQIGRTRVHALTFDQTLREIDTLIAKGDGVRQHAVVNAGKVVAAENDDTLVNALADCDIVNADGMSVVWASRLLGDPLPERVTGIDLMISLFGRAEDNGWSVYLLGAEQSVVRTVEERLAREHPRLVVAGARNGYWTADEDDAVVSEIRRSGATLLFVAMPSPRKELWVARHRADLGVALVMGVGGSFDVLAGKTRRAPTWMQRRGLEWFFRFIQEPRRMYRRYLVGNTRFIGVILRQAGQARRQKRAAPYSTGGGSSEWG